MAPVLQCRANLETAPECLLFGWGSHGSRLVDRFPAKDFWSLHAYPYRATWIVDGQVIKLAPGWWSLTPPGIPVEYRYEGPCSHLFARFLLGGRGTGLRLPLALDAGTRNADLWARLEEAQAALPSWPGRATALLWNVLWDYADLAGAAPLGPVATDLADRAAWILHQRHHDPMPIDRLADELGVTPRHLQRLFKQRHGTTIRDWLAKQKGERLRHLLGTEMDLTTIAREVGANDLHHLNKLSRRLLGDAPSRIRRSGR